MEYHSTPVQNQTVIFCSSSQADITQYRQDWNNRTNSQQEDEIEPYVNLTIPSDQAGDFYDQYGVPITFGNTRYYDTSACFWDYIESTFGHQAFQQVIQSMDRYTQQRGNTCMPLLTEIINPTLGTDISPITKARFGFDTTNSSCDS